MEIISYEDGIVIEQGKHTLKDAEYFSFFIEKSQKYSSEKIYRDYVYI